MSQPAEATYLAWLTPPGTGAIAALALRGPLAWPLLHELFQPTSDRAAFAALAPDTPAEAGRFWLGWLGPKGQGERDEVVLALKRGGPSPWFELHCHGGRQVLRLFEELFASRGVQVCSWQELVNRTAGEQGRSAALAALTAAPTARTAAIALDQYHGACDRAVAAACAALEGNDLQEAGRLLQELARFAPVGLHLAAPWKVVVLGAPNVGKSSLINLLTGYQRSVVAPTPGTTRDVVSSVIAIDGWPVELIDTAGWRPGAEALERQGIELARAAAATADLCLWVLDASAAPVWPDAELPALHFIVNKTDLPPAWDLAQAVRVSAQTGAGLPALCQALSGWLVPEPPPPGAAVPFTPTLCAAVEQAIRGCGAGQANEALRALRAVVV